MNREKTTLWLVLGAVLAQWYFIYTSKLFDMQLPFSTGLLVTDTAGGNAVQVLFSMIPIPFLLWFFSGWMTEIIGGIGKIYIIRDYSREKLFCRKVCKMIIMIGAIECFTWVTFQFASPEEWSPLTLRMQGKIMLLYTLSLIVTVLVQFCLELGMGAVYAQFATLLYYTGSLFLYGLIYSDGLSSAANWILFPNLGYAMRNGVIGIGTGTSVYDSLVGLTTVGVILWNVALKIIKKKDIM